jgi:hypothetical protein
MDAATIKDRAGQALIGRLERLLGSGALLSDAKSRSYYANDIFWQPGIEPLAIALPATREEAAAVVRAATSDGVAVVPRGGGMSYTKGYLPAKPPCLLQPSFPIQFQQHWKSSHTTNEVETPLGERGGRIAVSKGKSS